MINRRKWDVFVPEGTCEKSVRINRVTGPNISDSQKQNIFIVGRNDGLHSHKKGQKSGIRKDKN